MKGGPCYSPELPVFALLEKARGGPCYSPELPVFALLLEDVKGGGWVDLLIFPSGVVVRAHAWYVHVPVQPCDGSFLRSVSSHLWTISSFPTPLVCF